MGQEDQGNSSEPTRFGISWERVCPSKGQLRVTRARLGHCVCCLCPSRLHLADGNSGDIPAQPCVLRPHGPPGTAGTSPLHPPLLAGSAAAGIQAQLLARLPFPGRGVITGSGSGFIQLPARLSPAPCDVAAVTRLTALGHAAGGPR